jgi:Homeodomain-like domain
VASGQELGRPSKIGDVGVQAAALLIAGYTTTEAAAMVGVARRTLSGWRARAYSRSAEDRPFVEFEQMVQRGRLAAAQVGQPQARGGAPNTPLAELLRDFD